jgi:Type IV secretion-system coupling protein DNA-binding domain/TraM recognition site of TraD and TraG
MSAPLRTMRLSWPREITADQLTTAIRNLASVGGTPLVFESVGQYGRVEHRLATAESRSPAVTTQLRATIPGLGIEGVSAESEKPMPTFNRVVELRLSTRRRTVSVDQAEAISRTLLTSLAHVGKDEALLLQWVFTARLPASVVPSKIDRLSHESIWKTVLTAPFGVPGPADAETRTALRVKKSEPGWQAIGRVAVRAASRPRQEQLIQSVLHALRTAEAPGVRLSAHSVSSASVQKVGGRARLRLNISEVAALCSWPIGPTADLPVVRLGSRRLPPPAGLPTTGRVIGEGTWPGEQQPLALSIEDSLRHLHVIGPTGTGKSTLLLGLIEQDVAAGRSVVVIEPKGDLIADVLARVPGNRVADVVLLDPTDQQAVVGINGLGNTGGTGSSPELLADQLLNTFHGLYAAHWGPRTSDILHAALLTLARTPGMSLAALPLLLGDPNFRRRIVSKLNDPIGLGPFWAQYEAWSDAERTAATAPVMNKLRPFLIRPTLRRVIGQTNPKFDLRSVFTGRKILLANVAKGQMGAEAASLLGALVLSGLWQVAQERSGIERTKRHPVMIYIDEFQDYLHLPTDLGDALAQARGLGIGFTLAHQHLGQLDTSMKNSVLANARSRICFQLGADDARIMAGTSTVLGSEDFSSLGAYQFYTQVMNAGAVQPWCSGRSLPPTKPISDVKAIRTAARSRYATPISEIDDALQALSFGNRGAGPASTAGDDLQPKLRRATGGTS